MAIETSLYYFLCLSLRRFFPKLFKRFHEWPSVPCDMFQINKMKLGVTCVCMCVCVCVYMCIYIHTYVYTHICVYMCVCMYMYIYVYICMYIHIYVYVCVYMYIYVCIHIYTHTHIYIYLVMAVLYHDKERRYAGGSDTLLVP